MGANLTPIGAPDPDVLTWREVDVDGVRTRYAVGGEGPPVLFLHGWGLSSRAYERPLRRLMRRGCRVWAPSLPGLGGSDDLPEDSVTVAGMGDWAGRFATAVGIEEPVMLMGHSFGGAVAISMAYQDPARVQYLMLLNAVGGGRWFGAVGESTPLKDRPLWDWGLHFLREGLQASTDLRAIRAMAPEVVGNLLRNPKGVVRSAQLAKDANLTAELAALRSWRVPVLALTSNQDAVIPQAAFEALCAAIGTDGHVVDGNHAWLLSDPDSMADVLANVVDVRVAEHRTSTNSSRVEALRELLAQTPMPADQCERLLAEASPLWLMSEEERTLAMDLALCMPALEKGEVRAVVRPVRGSEDMRLTVVAHDRPGLLADTAAIVAGEGLSIQGATAVTWPRMGMAMHALTLRPDELFGLERWEVIGERLRACPSEPVLPPALRPSARARVRVHDDAEDRTLLTVEADDQLGLLATVCRHLADAGATIESLGARTTHGVARDSFVLRGEVDHDGLVALLRGARLPRQRLTATG